MVNPYRIPAEHFDTIDVRELFYITPWNRSSAFMVATRFPNLTQIISIKTISDPSRLIEKYKMEPAIGRITIFEPVLCDKIEIYYKAMHPSKICGTNE